MGKIINTIRKYKYLSHSWLKTFLHQLLRRLRAFSFNYKNFVPDILKIHELPFPVRWKKIFGYDRLYYEIGTGHGELINYLSKKNSDCLYIGTELTKQYSLLSAKKIRDRKNAFIFKADGYYYSDKLFAPGSLSGIYVLFPDPWHKKRHHKRRPLVHSWFVAMHKMLRQDGFILFATDWEEYYNFVSEQVEGLENLYKIENGFYVPEEQDVVATHYYKKWKEIGREFRYIRLYRIES